MAKKSRSTPGGQYEKYFKPKPGKCIITLRNISRTIRNAFKSACDLRGKAMNEVAEELFRKYARNGGEP